MSNPYQPPQAALADADDPREMPRRLRIPRAIALGGSGFLGVLALVSLYNVPWDANPTRTLINLALVVISVVSILALTVRTAERPVRWSAMAINGVALACACYSVFGGSPGALLLLVPALLNMVAIELLRRARAAQGGV